ncbi:hypothetical protein ACGFNU_49865 [Spirillospora sp. NPDC048911]|uniref:hypothetical protein n=1 Tax=Spirillospora sp. NPDC048911 TaxID=3364527 RepID=UPI0037127ADC
MSSSAASFPFHFNLGGDFTFGPDNRSSGYFGTDVLARLIAGIDDFRATAEREPRFRSLGPAVLGAFMWLDDPELIQRIADFPHASVVITKQVRGTRPQVIKRQQAKLDKLQPLLEHKSGFPAYALPELQALVLRGDDGEPPIVGPFTPMQSLHLPAIRTLGFRKTDDHLVPILHTKMLLLGELWWHDEDDLGSADVTGFAPQRLWLGSANGTTESRSNLEFGIWLREGELLRKAKEFLGWVLGHSEALDPDADDLLPDLVQPDYDDDAFYEYMARFADEQDGEPQ